MSMHQILGDVATAIAAVLQRELPPLGPDWWQSNVVDRLSIQQQRLVNERRVDSLSGLDLAGLLRVGRLDAEHLNDPGNMLCLCADVAAQFMYAEFAWLDSVEEKVLGFKAEKEGGTEAMRRISVRVAGKTLAITWSERHFLRLCALWKAA